MPYKFTKLDNLSSQCIEKAEIHNGTIHVTYDWERYTKDSFLTGSYVICEEDPEWAPRDIDFAVLVDKEFLVGPSDWWKSYGFPGFHRSSEHYEETHFEAWRNSPEGGVNLICFWEKDYFENYRKSTKEATEQKLWKKEDRVVLFQRNHDEFESSKSLVDWV